MAQSVFATDTVRRSATMWTGLPESIILPPLTLSGRKEYSEEDIKSLAYDIAVNGQDTPVKIRKTKDGQPELVYGRRRYLAVKYANDHKLGKSGPIELQANYEANMSDEDALIAAIRENWQRKEITDADHAFNIGQLLKFAKKSVEQIAEIYFPGAVTPEAKADAVRWVRVRGQIDQELVDEGKQAMREGIVTITTATELTKLPPATQREVIADPKSKKTVKGRERITVSAVKAHKPAPVSRKGATASAGKPAAGKGGIESFQTPKKVEQILRAAETMALAIDAFMEDATENADKLEDEMIAAANAYRKLVPNFALLEGSAA